LRRHRHPPVVYTHHFALHFGIRGVDAAARAYDCVMRRFAARAHAVVTTTSSYRELFPSANGDVHTVPWGIEQNAFAPGPDDRFDGTRPLRVLAVGQLRRYKGMMIAVRAVAGVPGITLTVAGDGPLLGEIEYQIGVADAANVTLCRGPSNAELHDLYREHDVIVLPSRTRAEAFGIVLLEGMASGCVPVASDLPGVRDVIADIGLTATPGSPASLRARLLQLAVNPAEVERRRHLAIEHAARFSWKSTVDAYEGLFLDVVAKSATVSR
jgi:glycosyltransferase involved in cell wall biosynthesis